MLKEETQINIRLLEDIRDDKDNLPAVRMQAIQTMQKIIDNMGAATTEERPSADDIMKKIRGAKK